MLEQKFYRCRKGVDKLTRTEYEAKVKASHEKIYKMYLNGMDKKEIARNTDYSEAYVDLIIRKAKGPTERRSMSDADRNRIKKLRGEGKIIREIASEIGFSMSAVQKYLKEQEETEKEKEKEPENEPVPLAMANRKPQARITYIKGKRYKDVSEFYLGI